MEEKVFVLDTSGFIARWPLYAPRATIYTTSLVISEVKDSESKQGLEIALLLDRIHVLDPRQSYIKQVIREARKRGLHISLSKTDISVAALALQLRERGLEVEVITDDYSLQNLLALLGIKYRPLRTRGIRRVEEYIVVCPACGYTSRNPAEKTCPVCGTPLKRIRKKAWSKSNKTQF